MGDEFQLVQSRRKKKNCQTVSVSLKSSVTLYDSDTLYKKLLKVTEEFEKTWFCTCLIESLEKILEEITAEKLDEILSYGLGKFSENKSSLHQLSALVIIQKQFNCTVKIFDPIFDPTEVTVLKKLDFDVLLENEEGKRNIEKVTLVYLPHCPKQLTNNFLWANWNFNLKKCIIISNSFSKIIQSNTKKNLIESANYIKKLYNCTVEKELLDSYEIPNVFNDLSIHYFTNLTCNFFEGDNKEPVYLKDTEFITKEIKNVQ